MRSDAPRQVFIPITTATTTHHHHQYHQYQWQPGRCGAAHRAAFHDYKSQLNGCSLERFYSVWDDGNYHRGESPRGGRAAALHSWRLAGLGRAGQGRQVLTSRALWPATDHLPEHTNLQNNTFSNHVKCSVRHVGPPEAQPGVSVGRLAYVMPGSCGPAVVGAHTAGERECPGPLITSRRLQVSSAPMTRM